MKKTLSAFFASSMLALTFVPTMSVSSHAAAAYNVNKLQSQGFRACKALGDTGYTGIVRGTSLNEDSLFTENGFGKFYVRSCFQTKAECSNYVNNFEKLLIAVNEIDHRSCKLRG